MGATAESERLPVTFNLKTCLRVAAVAFGLYLCIFYWPSISGALGVLLGALQPLLLGGAIAYVVNLPMAFFERKLFPLREDGTRMRGARSISLLLAVLVLVAIFVGLAMLVVPEVIDAVKLLMANAPNGISDVLGRLQSWGLTSDSAIGSLVIDVENSLQETVAKMADPSNLNQVLGATATLVSSLVSGATNALIAFVFALYVLVAKDRLRVQIKALCKRYMPTEVWTRTFHVINVADESFHGYIVGQSIEACILGGLCALGMTILGMPYAVMTGAVVGCTALIPVAGAYIGGLVGFLMVLTVSPLQAFFFLVFLVVLQQIEGNLIYPRVVGTTIGLPGIWVLGAVILGAGISGILGMVLAVPLVATLYKLVYEQVKAGVNDGGAEPPAPALEQPAREAE